MQPTRRLVIIAILWTVLGFAAGLSEPLVPIWTWMGIVVGILLIIDGIINRLLPKPVVERTLPGRFAIGIEQLVPITLHNGAAIPIKVQCYDCLLYTSPSPRDLSTSRMPSSA